MTGFLPRNPQSIGKTAMMRLLRAAWIAVILAFAFLVYLTRPLWAWAGIRRPGRRRVWDEYKTWIAIGVVILSIIFTVIW